MQEDSGVTGAHSVPAAVPTGCDRAAAPRRAAGAVICCVDSAVHLSVPRELLVRPALEAWLDEHLIARIPGASDAG
jgi:hypothetical protein